MMRPDRNPLRPDDFHKVDILRRLLKLARAGKIGPVYAYDSCRLETVLEIGAWVGTVQPLHIRLERRRISWREALNLADSRELERKPVARALSIKREHQRHVAV